MKPYGGNPNRLRLPDMGELLGIALLLIIGGWGVWFGWQAAISLWWPLNLAYAVAGAAVAIISVAVSIALLNR